MSLSTQQIDLTTCEQEPIHIPGSIQPHGVLFALAESDLSILQVSQTLFAMCHIAPESVIGKPVSAVLGTEASERLRRSLAIHDPTAPALTVSLPVADDSRRFEAVVHRHDGVVILELEPTATQTLQTNSTLTHLRTVLAEMHSADSLDGLCQIAAEAVRALAGYDRVMVYQFDTDWNGVVVAEAQDDRLESFRGLHFPAADIPSQARRLYLQNRLRIIVDASYRPSPIVPALNPQTSRSLDLSYAVLRSVSPMHLAYLKNMGVHATLTISIVHEGALWGLIACHHYQTRHIGADIRTACELLAQMLAAQITAVQIQTDHAAKQHNQLVLQRVMDTVINQHQARYGEVLCQPDLLELVAAQGAAICDSAVCHTIGRVPPESDIRELVAWLSSQDIREAFSTTCLPQHYPAAQAFADRGSGLLAIALSPTEKTYVLWFQPEVIQTMMWGGDPTKPVEVSTDGRGLTPRRSFQAWKETVRQTSLPWKPYEVAAAITLRRVLADLTLRRVAEAQRRQDEVIQAQAHALTELSTPLIPISDDILVMPLIGTMDSFRAEQVLETLMQGVSSRRASTAILDITGVAVVDTGVADALLRAAQAVQLLGAEVILTGIRPEIAQTLVGLGVNLQRMVTCGTLQHGIAYALRQRKSSLKTHFQ